jgi:hypothetical protein
MMQANKVPAGAAAKLASTRHRIEVIAASEMSTDAILDHDMVAVGILARAGQLHIVD